MCVLTYSFPSHHPPSAGTRGAQISFELTTAGRELASKFHREAEHLGVCTCGKVTDAQGRRDLFEYARWAGKELKMACKERGLKVRGAALR